MRIRLSELTSVGWVFWMITSAVLIGPFIWGAYAVLLERAPKPFPPVAGALTAMIFAAIVTATVNSLLQRREAARAARRRKQTKRK